MLSGILVVMKFPASRPLKSLLLSLWLCLSAWLTAAEPFTLTVLNLPDIQRGAGLAIVMRTPAGKTYLYDTGSGYPERLSSDGWQSNFNAGRDLIAPWLEKAGVREIDVVFLSHAHYDHFGGLLWLSEHAKIGKLIDSGYVFSGAADGAYSSELGDYTRVREAFKKRGAYLEAHSGEVLALDPALKVEVLAPPKAFFTEALTDQRAKNDPPAHYLVNANSLGIRIQHGDVVFYLPGDIQSEDINHSLLKSVDLAKLKCQVLIAPGHGLHCTQEFAEATRPEVSIASVFPRYAKGLKSTPIFKAVGAKTYITGLQGQIQVVSDGKTYHVTAEHPEAGR